MSSPPDTDFQVMAKDSLISSVLGSAAMGARLLLSPEPVGLAWIVRRTLAACITAVFVGLVAQDYIHSKGALYASIGVSGAAAPEIMDFIIKYVRARGEREVSNVTKAKKPSKKRRK
jgi:hypothetical protein